jgi:hypothetical protein
VAAGVGERLYDRFVIHILLVMAIIIILVRIIRGNPL